jgi:hypothetical protein
VREAAIPLDDSVEHFLLTGDATRGTPGWALRVSRFFDCGAAIRAAWAQHKDALMTKWRTEKRRGLPWAQAYLEKNEMEESDERKIDRSADEESERAGAS